MNVARCTCDDANAEQEICWPRKSLTMFPAVIVMHSRAQCMSAESGFLIAGVHMRLGAEFGPEPSELYVRLCRVAG